MFRPTRPFVIAASAAGIVLGLSACGSGESGTSPEATEVVEVTMVDNAFEPDRLQVAAGESVTFRFRNEGRLDHEAFVGTSEEQASHQRDMAGGEGMEHGGDEMDHGGDEMDHGEAGGGDDDAISVAAGETEELTITFDEPATLEIGCHVPGHYESGMKATLSVA